jgi:hypothetical protein
MKAEPKIVDNSSGATHRSKPLKVRIRISLNKYLINKLNEQLALGLIHSGYEPVAGKKFVYFKLTGNKHWKRHVNTFKIRFINWLLIYIVDN